MGDLALYRKYRSHNFADVVGQKHVVDTLSSALASGRISHAYLFTGPRGVGKTSVARLLAQAVNCLGDKERPCANCDICKIPLASNVDIIEIDAASNRRIDEMRDLRDKVNLAPAQSKYKVYIIDEVHMLTTEAFNALLKTLEEPPSHVIFILATTEAHKLPETIISRTQRYNFHPITQDDIVGRLKHIASAEKITIEDDALALIAQTARGGLRDAVSMLDQSANASNEKITVAHVRATLGWGNFESLVALTQAIAEKNAATAFTALDTLIAEGAQIGQVIAQSLELWRMIMRAHVGASNTGDARLTEVAKKLDATFISRVIDALATASLSQLPTLALEHAILLVTANVSTAAPKPTPAIPSVKLTPAPATAKPTSATPKAEASGDLWPKALVMIKSYNNSLYALVRSCGVNVSADAVHLTCRFNFHRDRLLEAKNRQALEQILAKVYGHPMKLECQLENQTPVGVTANSDNELVDSALEILGGEVVDG